MSRRKKIIAALVTLPLLVCAVLLLTPEPPPPPPLPVPNGFDDFVAATKLLVGKPPGQEETDPQTLRAFLNNNTNALRMLENGLVRECRISTPFSPNYIHTQFSFLPFFRRLENVLEAVGKLAEAEGRTNEAVRAYLDGIVFAHEQARGGAMSDRLVGIACEWFPRKHLARLAPTLDALTCREVIIRLEALEAKRESAEAMLAQEKEWFRLSVGWKEKVQSVLEIPSQRKREQGYAHRVNQAIQATRHLLVDFAVRAYQLETGKRPKSLADLVPAYLKSIPIDPETGTALKYDFE